MRSRLRSFVALSARERRALLAAVAAVAGVRVLLWVLPYAAARSLLERTARKSRPIASAPVSPDRVAVDVARAARILPRATCLVQALAGEWLITRNGDPARVCFGVARGDRGFEAHAWLESRGRVILGGEAVARFTPLT